MKEQEAGTKTADVCRKYGQRRDLPQVEGQVWRSGVCEARRLKGLQDENTRLKRLLADAMLDNAALKEIAGKLVTPDTKRQTVHLIRDKSTLSERKRLRHRRRGASGDAPDHVAIPSSTDHEPKELYVGAVTKRGARQRKRK